MAQRMHIAQRIIGAKRGNRGKLSIRVKSVTRRAVIKRRREREKSGIGAHPH